MTGAVPRNVGCSFRLGLHRACRSSSSVGVVPQLLCAFDGTLPPQRTSLRQSWGMAKRGRFISHWQCPWVLLLCTAAQAENERPSSASWEQKLLPCRGRSFFNGYALVFLPCAAGMAENERPFLASWEHELPTMPWGVHFSMAMPLFFSFLCAAALAENERPSSASGEQELPTMPWGVHFTMAMPLGFLSMRCSPG